METRTLKYSPEGPFLGSLKQAVETYFKRKGLSPYADFQLHAKGIILFGSWILCYLYIMLENSTPGMTMLLCCALGVLSSFVNFNIMHDASHGAYSKDDRINTWLARTLNLVGGSDFMWKTKHVVLHHTFVNTEHDEDIETGGLLRMSPRQPWKPRHKYQHLYALILYSLLAIQWIYVNDYKKYFTQEIHGKKIRMKDADKYVFWITKILHLLLFVFIPYLIFGWIFIFGWLVYFMTVGVVISVVFQLAHVHEHACFTETTSGKIPTSWAEQQVLETMDFGVDSPLLTWFLGGLNFQTVHHLFPRVSHTHYPTLQKIVAGKCREFSLSYTEVTFWYALKSHFRHLRNLGKK